MPEFDQIEVNQGPKTKRLGHGQDLSAEKQAAALQAVDYSASDSA
jgi:hypothetical protein